MVVSLRWEDMGLMGEEIKADVYIVYCSRGSDIFFFFFVLIILYSLYLEYDSPLVPSASGLAG